MGAMRTCITAGISRNSPMRFLARLRSKGRDAALERTPLPETRPGPHIGEHTQEILETVLHLSSEEIARLTEAGVLA